MQTSQWIGIALLLLLIGGLVYAFVRHGAKVKPDQKHDVGGIGTSSGDNHGGYSESGGH
jgi:hypothetical protein